MKPSYQLVQCHLSDVADFICEHHAYGSAAKTCAYAFAVLERQRPVAAYLWMPPAPGAATVVCPEAPFGVLALSRMVAVPRDERELNHVSKPLRRQMKVMIDRGRWPVLVTYSDESMGHTGHVYKCSGWHKAQRRKTPVYKDESGNRVSRYSSGTHNYDGKSKHGYAWIQRWEHWACPRGQAMEHIRGAGWERRAINRVWASGAQAHTWVKDKQLELL